MYSAPQVGGFKSILLSLAVYFLLLICLPRDRLFRPYYFAKYFKLRLVRASCLLIACSYDVFIIHLTYLRHQEENCPSSFVDPQDLSAGEDVTYQLRVTLYDGKLQHFFGKTWKSSSQKMKNNKISFNEVTFCLNAFHCNNNCSCKVLSI